MGKNILITGPKIDPDAEKLLKENNFEITFTENYPATNKLVEIAESNQIDALLVRMGEITEDVLKASSNLKAIAKHGTGVNTIDVETASKLDIPVFIARNGNYISVAEHVVALMYGITKELVNLDCNLRKGIWGKSIYSGGELHNKSLGLIGFGRIARKVVDILKPLNMKVSAYDPYIKDDSVFDGVNKIDDLKELLSSSKYVSIHCPLTEETANLLGEKEFKLMREDAFIINTARGGIINEKELIKALDKNWIAGAGLDTFAEEPTPEDNPLLELPNVILTPHIGGVTGEAFHRMGMESAEHLINAVIKEKIDKKSCINYSKIN